MKSKTTLQKIKIPKWAKAKQNWVLGHSTKYQVGDIVHVDGSRSKVEHNCPIQGVGVIVKIASPESFGPGHYCIYFGPTKGEMSWYSDDVVVLLNRPTTKPPKDWANN